jgi:hypothetical protein
MVIGIIGAWYSFAAKNPEQLAAKIPAVRVDF